MSATRGPQTSSCHTQELWCLADGLHHIISYIYSYTDAVLALKGLFCLCSLIQHLSVSAHLIPFPPRQDFLLFTTNMVTESFLHQYRLDFLISLQRPRSSPGRNSRLSKVRSTPRAQAFSEDTERPSVHFPFIRFPVLASTTLNSPLQDSVSLVSDHQTSTLSHY